MGMADHTGRASLFRVAPLLTVVGPAEISRQAGVRMVRELPRTGNGGSAGTLALCTACASPFTAVHSMRLPSALAPAGAFLCAGSGMNSDPIWVCPQADLNRPALFVEWALWSHPARVRGIMEPPRPPSAQ